ncbi:MAG: D-beta-D-heptose 1-phosphate adenylyltransferase [Lentisphaerae bacterium ADurb.BinA184]|nr:MAG: D-beta-D-heptose 1-phosphate adenylyltransferase [Lentisphaerae bacterium ADurb.BinA184]
MRSPADKTLILPRLPAWRAEVRRQNRQLVVTNGCFDLLHRGHVEYLNRARAAGDCLLVLVNDDASVRAVKGPDRPIVCEADRLYMLASLEAVDAVLMFSTPTCTELFRQIVPDVYAKGGDYTEETLVREEYLLLKSQGCRFVFIPFVKGLSTTDNVRRIRERRPLGSTLDG